MPVDLVVKMWVEFDPKTSDPAQVALAKQVFESSIWPSMYQPQWENLLVSYTVPQDLRDKLNAEFGAKRAMWNIDLNIKNADSIVGPFTNQAWRVGKGGLHEMASEPVLYTPHGAGPLTEWKFAYGTGKTAVVAVRASWTPATKL